MAARRRLEQRTEWPNGLVDEWHPYEPDGLDTSGWSASEFRTFVRDENRKFKAKGDWTRLRSVENDDMF